MLIMLRLLALSVLLVTGTPVAAQVPPTPAETAAYSGLFAAASRGDTAQIAQLLAQGADVKARDSYGRTPLHVAA